MQTDPQLFFHGKHGARFVLQFQILKIFCTATLWCEISIFSLQYLGCLFFFFDKQNLMKNSIRNPSKVLTIYLKILTHSRIVFALTCWPKSFLAQFFLLRRDNWSQIKLIDVLIIALPFQEWKLIINVISQHKHVVILMSFLIQCVNKHHFFLTSYFIWRNKVYQILFFKMIN